MEDAKPSVRRCAVYTRKSSEEGLEQDFNSLHAQREACEAFIKSQAGEGWRLVRTAYDDGGLSGGTMDRPALRRLLDDIRHGLIDVIVVYKVDRLTRSLADFAKMVEIFDAQDVSFVAVTQQFNTTTSMGRLTLNVLLSFAQFEREVTGERIRDKFAASKRKGMWMGGVPPLGYDISERRLIVNEPEAVIVREIFERYLVLGSVRLLRNDLERRGVVSKVRVSRTGIKTGGRSFSRGALYELLSNPIYIGEVRHKQERHPGQHEAILERELWERVQHHLREQAAQHRKRPTKASPSPLAGKLFDENGAPLYAQGAMKDGRRYRYYVSRELVRGSGEQARAGWRLPAPELERAVVGAARSILDDKQTVLTELQESGIGLWEVDRIFEMTSACNGRLLAETESAAALVEVIEKVQLTAEGFRIVLKISIPCGSTAGHAGAKILRVSRFVPMKLKRRGVELRIILGGKDEIRRKVDPALLKAIARARRWFEEVASGHVPSLAAIARREHLAKRYVARLTKLAFITPSVVEAVVEGRAPAALNLQMLMDPRFSLPLSWKDQERLLEFQQ
jgi:DNA invertase Pin-like site-specific DNA recombinase